MARVTKGSTLELQVGRASTQGILVDAALVAVVMVDKASTRGTQVDKVLTQGILGDATLAAAILGIMVDKDSIRVEWAEAVDTTLGLQLEERDTTQALTISGDTTLEMTILWWLEIQPLHKMVPVDGTILERTGTILELEATTLEALERLDSTLETWAAMDTTLVMLVAGIILDRISTL